VRAGQVVGPGRFEVVEVPDPVPDDGQILVAMRSASICGSDLHRVFATDPTPFPLPPGRPGHEGVGRVVESRSPLHSPGDWVLTVPVAGDGGAYAELAVVGGDFAIALAPGTDLDRALMAQQLGTVIYGFHRYWPAAGSAGSAGWPAAASAGSPARSGASPAAAAGEGRGLRAGVVGMGSAGLFALQLARLAGFEEIVVSDLDQPRLDVAAKLGATVTVHAPDESFVDTAAELSGGAGLDLVIDATGFDSCRADCIEAVRYHGRVGYFGLPEHPGLVPFPLARAFRKGCTIEMAGVAQLEPGLASFREALGLIGSGQIDVDTMIEARYPLDRFGEAMEAARAHVAPKVNLDLTDI
jgi:L-iditol 2-dehydrogenase